MPVRVDPKESETRVLGALAGSMEGRRVLEVGCGDGRLTWRYSEHAGYVFALDPDPARIAAATAALPLALNSRITFVVATLDMLTPPAPGEKFDLAILSRSL